MGGGEGQERGGEGRGDTQMAVRCEKNARENDESS